MARGRFCLVPNGLGLSLDRQLRSAIEGVYVAAIRHLYPSLRHVFADGAYSGTKLNTGLDKSGQWTIEIVKRSDTACGFVVFPRRWPVERTLARLSRDRRLAKDFELKPAFKVPLLGYSSPASSY